MKTMDTILIALLVFLIFGSVVALEIRDLLSAVIAAGVVGLGLSIVFLLLGAPDIAITQVVVEVIVVTVLIRATVRTGREEPAGHLRARLMPVLGIAGVVVVAAFLVVGFLALPRFGAVGARPSDWYLAAAPAQTGATNVVTAILLDFRAYDTLGEATVILAAVAGVLAVLRRPARSRAHRVPRGGTATRTGGTPAAEPEPEEAGHV
jgi:multisubunit Na+/H+ antiporter MnhB subunit